MNLLMHLIIHKLSMPTDSCCNNFIGCAMGLSLESQLLLCTSFLIFMFKRLWSLSQDELDEQKGMFSCMS